MTSLRPTRRALVLAAAGLLPALLPAFGVEGGGLVWAGVLALLALALAVDFLACPRPAALEVAVEAPPVLHLAAPRPGVNRRAARAAEPTGAAETSVAAGTAPTTALTSGPVADHLTVTLRLPGHWPGHWPGRRPLTAEVLPELSPELAPVRTRRLRLPAMEADRAPAGPGARGVSSVSGVPGAPGVEVRFPLRPRRRGRARLDELWVAWDGPLGLVRRTAVRRPRLAVDVTPDLARVQRDALENVSQRDALPGQKLERYLGQGSEFHALREWIPGMERRSVDWKASARHTRLLAREVRAERNHQVVVAVDTGRLMAEPLRGVPRLDHAIHAALVLAAVGLRSGDRVGLFAFDDQARAYAPPRSGRDTLAALVGTAAGLEYSTAETAFTLALTELARRLRRRSLVVVLTDFVDSVTAELMVDTLVRLARRQLVVFVAFRDPVLGDLMAAEPARRRDLDRAVVAGALARDRRRVLARLSRAGVHVVDTAPEDMGPALIDRYLDIKRRELL